MKPAPETTAGLSAHELATILEQLPSGVVVVDQHGYPTLMNDAARWLLRQPRLPCRSLIDIALGNGMREASSGRPVTREATPLARALRGEVVSGEEYVFGPRPSEPAAQSPAHAQTQSGEAERRELRLRISGIPRRDATGRIIGAVTVFTNVTAEREQGTRLARLFEAEQRARAETEHALAQLEQELAERRRAEEALAGSEQRLRLALESSHMGTWDYDVARDHLEWSSEMATIVGAPLEPLGGSLGDAFAYVHPEDAPAVQRALREALESGRSLKIEARVQPKGGSGVRWLMIRGRVYRDEHGQPLRMIGIAMDISDRKEAETARQMLAHSERLRALGQMASGIAHDLNQSLALITGYSEMVRQELSSDLPDVPRVREMVEITARAAFEGGQALKGLLSFVRTQELMAEHERFELADVLDDAARLTAPRWRDASQAEGRPIRLHVEAEPGVAILGSPGALREAITNLIFNAVDALPQGGEIRLRGRRVGDQALVEVSDTGTGIPPDVQARIFDPFFTTKGERGTGLGLPQVAAIVERHNGSLALDSAPGRGTTFRLHFPLADAPPAQPADASEHAPASGASPSSPSGPQRPVSILVVEDEQQLARMAGMVLTQRGHHVVVVESFEQAMQHLEAERFELIISDLGLGTGKNGWDLAQEVRERWPSTRFVLVTGWGAAIDPKEAQVRGVHEVIAKPYRIADLRQIAERVASGPAPE